MAAASTQLLNCSRGQLAWLASARRSSEVEHAWTLSLLDALPSSDPSPAAATAAGSDGDAEEGGRRRSTGDADSAEEGDATLPIAELSADAKEDLRLYLDAMRRRGPRPQLAAAAGTRYRCRPAAKSSPPRAAARACICRHPPTDQARAPPPRILPCPSLHNHCNPDPPPFAIPPPSPPPLPQALPGL